MPSGAALARAFLGGGTRDARGALLDLQVALLLALLAGIQLWTWLVPDGGEPLADWVTPLWLAAFLTASLAHVVALLLIVAALTWMALARLRRPDEAPSRRDYLARAALVVAGLLLAPYLREFIPGPARKGQGLTLVTANVLGHHDPSPEAVAELVDMRADVLVLVELTGPWRRALEPALREDYPHQVLRDRADAFGLGVYSRLPMREAKWLPGTPLGLPVLRFEVEWRDTWVPMIAVHTMPPRTLEYVRWHRQMVRELLEEVDGSSGPLFLVGDFNFGINTPQHRALLARGFRDGYSDAGLGHGKTWPVLGFTRALPGMRLDHVYARGFTCFDASLGVGHGSDHRPVWTRWLPDA